MNQNFEKETKHKFEKITPKPNEISRNDGTVL